jgi:trans-aconitate 2-methyltransferase
MTDWNAETYHRVSNPQFEFGVPVLARLPLRGDELVLDVGCGTGRLTERVIERVPHGRVIGIDLSANMLGVAREYLRPRYGSRVALVRATATALPVSGVADAIFSTATFHWIRDHRLLFQNLFAALKPGGRLVAQCGGGPNVRRLNDRALSLMHEPEFEPWFDAWSDPWNYAEAAVTGERLTETGFVDVETNVEPTPVVQPDAGAFHVFVTNVIARPFLAHLTTDDLRRRFVDRLTDQAAQDDPPFELDYWRLNMSARKPQPVARH